MKKMDFFWNGQLVPVCVEQVGDFIFYSSPFGYFKTPVNPKHIKRKIGSLSLDNNSNQLQANMPGKILDIFAKPGESYLAGTTLIVLEAMKMEHQLKISVDKKVSTVHIKEGDQVKLGDLLISLE